MKKIISFCIIGILVVIMATGLYSEEKKLADIQLPQVSEKIETTLLTALKNRKSTRDFKKEHITLENLSAILWAGLGINRENGKRTIPIAMEKDFLKLYVYSNEGLYLYIPAKNLLKQISHENSKSKIVKQSSAADADYIILITAETSKLPFYLKKEQKETMAHANSGCIAQSIYLMSSALNLGTCMMAYFDEKGINESLTLNKNEIPLYIMPVGIIK
ncbi:SagB/ThcOx family dehydrogenase [Candidatus Dependentiae bacterium]|nr:SagB/ThcOx family dehydrogenase [Candidatus Dependentiae bacterium]